MMSMRASNNPVRNIHRIVVTSLQPYVPMSCAMCPMHLTVVQRWWRCVLSIRHASEEIVVGFEQCEDHADILASDATDDLILADVVAFAGVIGAVRLDQALIAVLELGVALDGTPNDEINGLLRGLTPTSVQLRRVFAFPGLCAYRRPSEVATQS